MPIALEEKRLSLALQNLSACKHLQKSDLRNVSHDVLTLLFEQLMRNREINLHEQPLKDGSYKSNVLLQLSRICSHMQRVVGCWLDTKKNIKWGGPLCGYFDPHRTIFIVDLNTMKSHKLRSKFAKFDKVLRGSVIKTWGCLEWSPLTTWFKEVLFEGTGAVDWAGTRKIWRHPSFQVFAKHIRIDMSGIELNSPTILLDALLSYLGHKHIIDTLDIKVSAILPEPWPVSRKAPEGRLPMPIVPALAIIWKWQDICDAWMRKDRAAISVCSCCWKRRPKIRYWNVAKDPHESWTPMKLRDDDHFFDYRTLQWTCTERRYWEGKRSAVPEAVWKTWFNFFDCSITDKQTENICTLLDNFLVDIEAFNDVFDEDEAEAGIQEA